MRCAICYAELPPESEKCPKCNAVAQRAPGERRQITALFCDIVGSTQLAAELEVEDYTEVLDTFHKVCAQIVVAHGGHLAQYLGDGVMAYFGHPTAHEDDPHRAVRAALQAVEIIPTLQRLAEKLGARPLLRVRVGIDTGLVVIGAGPSGLATGQALNYASHVQAIAEPNSVFITGETQKLIAAQFDCVSVGTRALKGSAPAGSLYRVLSERVTRVATATLTPFVGRQRELEVLLSAWQAVSAGEARSFIVVGDAGLGKTRLVEQFIKVATSGDDVRVLRGQGSAHHQHTAFHPLIQILEQLTGQSGQMSLDARGAALTRWLEANALDRQAVPAILQLLGQASTAESLPALDPGRKGQIIENAKKLLSKAAEHAPVVLIMEDLHWVDPSTLDVLGALQEMKSVLLLGTCRLVELTAWADASRFPKLELERLLEPDVDAIVRWIAAGSLQASLLEAVVRTTDGVPLFVEEQTRMLLESAGESDRPHTIAPSLQASLLARLDRLGEAKRVAQFAAVVGRSVPRALLTAGSELAGNDFDAALEKLTSAGLLRQVEESSSGPREAQDASLAGSGGLGEWSPGATYIFKHALVQEAAYQSLLKADRRRFHAIVADRLERGGFASASRNPEILAHHHGQARAFAKSARYGLAAARRAMDAGGYREAKEHIDHAVTRLAELPDDTETSELELELRLLEGFCLICAMGYGAPSVHQAFARAKELVTGVQRHTGDSDLTRTFSVLWGVWSFFLVLPDFAQASVLGAEMARLAHESNDRSLALELGVVLGMPALWAGQLETARQHFESTLELGASNDVGALRFNQDPVVVAGAHLSWIYWLQGNPAKAKAASERAIAFAQRIGHPYSEAYARAYGSVLSFFLRDPIAAKQNAATLEMLSDKYGFPTWKAVGSMIRGWALACDGEAASALPLVEESFNLWELVGVGMNRPARLAIRAEVKARAGNAAGAHADVEEALAMGASNGDLYYEAELTRLRGEFTLLGELGAAGRAERDFERAIQIATAQGATVLAERAVASLRELRAIAPPSSGVALVPGAEHEETAESGVKALATSTRASAR